MSKRAGQALTEYTQIPVGRLNQWAHDLTRPGDLASWLKIFDALTAARWNIARLSDGQWAHFADCQNISHWKRLRNRLVASGYIIVNEDGISLPDVDCEWARRDVISRRNRDNASGKGKVSATAADSSDIPPRTGREPLATPSPNDKSTQNQKAERAAARQEKKKEEKNLSPYPLGELPPRVADVLREGLGNGMDVSPAPSNPGAANTEVDLSFEPKRAEPSAALRQSSIVKRQTK